MHHDSPVEAARERRGDEVLQVALAGPARQAGGDEDRLVGDGDAAALELVDRRRDRLAPRVALGGRERERRRLDDDRRAAAAPCERLERLAGEREPQRLAHGGADVHDPGVGRGRAEHDRVVRRGDDDEPRAREERDAHLTARRAHGRHGRMLTGPCLPAAEAQLALRDLEQLVLRGRLPEAGLTKPLVDAATDAVVDQRQ